MEALPHLAVSESPKHAENAGAEETGEVVVERAVR
jgi:hypothetical protein